MVQPILGEEERFRLGPTLSAALGDHADVAAGTEPARPGVIQHHRRHRRVVLPREQRFGDQPAHLFAQGMQRLGPVQGQTPHPSLDADQDRRLGGGGVGRGHGAGLASLGAGVQPPRTSPRRARHRKSTVNYGGDRPFSGAGD
jgi:hypothetical protein